MSFSAGPVVETKQKEKIKPYLRFIDMIRYEFARRGMIMEEPQAILLWNQYFLPKYLKGQ